MHMHAHAHTHAHAGMIVNTMIKLMKLFIKKKLSDRIQICTKEQFFTKLGYKEGDISAPYGTDSTTISMELATEYFNRRKISIEKVKINQAASAGAAKEDPVVAKLAAKVVAL